MVPDVLRSSDSVPQRVLVPVQHLCVGVPLSAISVSQCGFAVFCSDLRRGFKRASPLFLTPYTNGYQEPNLPGYQPRYLTPAQPYGAAQKPKT